MLHSHLSRSYVAYENCRKVTGTYQPDLYECLGTELLEEGCDAFRYTECYMLNEVISFDNYYDAQECQDELRIIVRTG